MIRKLSLRPAFTLVELLVAMAIAVALLALAVGISQSSAFDSYKITGAADRFSQYLLTAKQRALRDRAPRGVRLIFDQNTTDPFLRPMCREIAYIEQPDMWVAPPAVELRVICGDRTQDVTSSMPNVQRVNTITDKRVVLMWPAIATNADIITEFEYAPGPSLPVTPNPDAAVRVGDVLLIPELGCAHRIIRMEQLQAVPTMSMVPPMFAQMTPAALNPGQLDGTANTSTHICMEIVLGATQAERLAAIPTSGAAYSNRPADTTTTVWPATFRITNSGFSFVRQPRPILGEPTVLLPQGTAVDMRRVKPNPMMPMSYAMGTAIKTSYHLPLPATITDTSTMPATTREIYMDIMFSPNGSVIGAADGLIAFLVRDIDKADQAGIVANTFEPLETHYKDAGDMVLVCVYTRTGAIATHRPNEPSTPPAPTTDDPYKFAKDGINTGL